MVDYWGYPKAAYSAHATLVRLLDGASPLGQVVTPPGVWAYAFNGGTRQVVVAWAADAGQSLSVGALTPSIPAAQVVEWVNSVGTPINATGTLVTLGPDPIFLVATPNPDAGTLSPPDASTRASDGGLPSPAGRRATGGCSCSETSGVLAWLATFAALAVAHRRRVRGA
jgi:uncharacterized protein (TIGR03382 family)